MELNLLSIPDTEHSECEFDAQSTNIGEKEESRLSVFDEELYYHRMIQEAEL